MKSIGLSVVLLLAALNPTYAGSAPNRHVTSQGVMAAVYHICAQEMTRRGYSVSPSLCSCIANRVVNQSKTTPIGVLKANAVQIGTEATMLCWR